MGNGKSILRSLCIYQLPITNYQLPITNYQSPITHYPLPITHYPLPITHYPLPITYKSSNVVPPLEIVALVPQCYSLALLV